VPEAHEIGLEKDPPGERTIHSPLIPAMSSRMRC